MSKEEFERLAQQRMMNFEQKPVERGEEGKSRDTFLITDTANTPPVCQAIYRAFKTPLRISESALKNDIFGKVKTKDGAVHPSPHDEFKAEPDLFMDFLNTLPGLMRGTGQRPTTSNIIRAIRGYDWQKVGWLTYKVKYKPEPQKASWTPEEGL